MVKYIVNTRDTRIFDVDYLFDKPEKFMKLVPYLKKKLDGDWRIAIIDPPIQFVREITDGDFVPEYVIVELYLEKSISERIMQERPRLTIKQKTAYEKYLDTIGDLKVLIDPKAAKELYMRVGMSKDKLPDYLLSLSEIAKDGKITVSDVRREVADERKVYASDVINGFLLHDRWRWKKYEELVSVLGRDYAFYAMRKYTTRLLQEKNRYLRNEETKLYIVDRIDSPGVCLAYTIFATAKSVELDMCMRMLENRELMRRII